MSSQIIDLSSQELFWANETNNSHKINELRISIDRRQIRRSSNRDHLDQLKLVVR